MSESSEEKRVSKRSGQTTVARDPLIGTVLVVLFAWFMAVTAHGWGVLWDFIDHNPHITVLGVLAAFVWARLAWNDFPRGWRDWVAALCLIVLIGIAGAGFRAAL